MAIRIKLVKMYDVGVDGIELDEHVWEGWTVGDFINELAPQLELIQAGKSWHKPFTDIESMAKWCAENQPYYKRRIPGVVRYFKELYFGSLKPKAEPVLHVHHDGKTVKIPMKEITGIAVSEWNDKKTRMEVAIRGDEFQPKYAVLIAVGDGDDLIRMASYAADIWKYIKMGQSIDVVW